MLCVPAVLFRVCMSTAHELGRNVCAITEDMVAAPCRTVASAGAEMYLVPIHAEVVFGGENRK